MILYSIAILYCIAFILIAIFWGGKVKFTTHLLTTAGIALASAFILHFITLFRLPMGGSITLVSSMPILFFSYRYGARWGIFLAFLFSFLAFFSAPSSVIHPAQFFLDYPIAYTSLGLAGLFRSKKYKTLPFVWSAFFALCCRYSAHVLSGVFAFGEFATGNPWIYSFIYNSFVFIDGGITLVISIILLQIKSLQRYLLPIFS